MTIPLDVPLLLTAEQRSLMVEDETLRRLIEADFDPRLHPRGRTGKFIDTFVKMDTGVPDTAARLVPVSAKSKARPVVDHVVEALDKVLRLPDGMPPIPSTSVTSGKNKRGSFRIEVADEFDRPVPPRPKWLRFSLTDGEGEDGYPRSPELTFAHEFGHYVDGFAFREQTVPGQTLWESLIVKAQTAPESVRAAFREDKPEVAAHVLDGPPSPLVEWWETIRESRAVKALASASMWDVETHRYLLRSSELWARSFAQWLALRSGDERLMSQVRAFQETLTQEERDEWHAAVLPEREAGVSIRSGPVSFSGPRPAKRHVQHRQWQDDDFAPIAAALDRVFASRGLLRG